MIRYFVWGVLVLVVVGGAVAYLGATQKASTTMNHHFNKLLFQGLYDHRVPTIGQLAERARADLLAVYGRNLEAEKIVKMYAWLGDPALRIGRK